MTIGDEQTARLLESVERGVSAFIQKRTLEHVKPDTYYQGDLPYEVEYKRFGIFRRTRTESRYMTLAGWTIPYTHPTGWILEDGAVCWKATWVRRAFFTGRLLGTREGLVYNRD